MKRPVTSILTILLLAATATAAFAVAPAAAHYRHYYGGPYGYFPRAYPYDDDYAPAYPPVVLAPPPVYAAPGYPAPVYPGPGYPAPGYPAPGYPAPGYPMVAAPAMPAPLPGALPPAAAGYPAAPAAPGIEGTPDCLVIREYTTEIQVGGKPAEGYGYACLQADGSWKRGAPAPAR